MRLALVFLLSILGQDLTEFRALVQGQCGMLNSAARVREPVPLPLLSLGQEFLAMHHLKNLGPPSQAERVVRSSSRLRAQGERRRFPTSTSGSPHLAHLSLEELRRYRAGLRVEEDRVSYWMRLVRVRLERLETGRGADNGLTLEQLTRVLGDTGSGRARGALMAVRGEGSLPDLPVLSTTWTNEVNPQDEAEAASAVYSLRGAESDLAEYRRVLHERIGEATGELIARYRVDPSSALQVVGL